MQLQGGKEWSPPGQISRTLHPSLKKNLAPPSNENETIKINAFKFDSSIE